MKNAQAIVKAVRIVGVVCFGAVFFAAVGCSNNSSPVTETSAPIPGDSYERPCTDHKGHSKAEQILADTYANYAALDAGEADNAYSRDSRSTTSTTMIFTPHGGGIEGGATEIADSVAATNYDYYSFTGLKTPNSANSVLHITATNFDEPTCVTMVQAATRTVAIHGCAETSSIVYCGGRDKTLRNAIFNQLKAAGFTADTVCPDGLNGTASDNITNRNTNGAGVQLEISKGLRQQLMTDLFNGPTKRVNSKTIKFTQFVNAIRAAL